MTINFTLVLWCDMMSVEAGMCTIYAHIAATLRFESEFVICVYSFLCNSI